MLYVSKTDRQSILDKTKIEDVIRAFHPELKAVGKDLAMCCPIHGERTPSFKVDVSHDRWHCFGCHEGGNAIDYLMKAEHMEYGEAMRWLADRCGVKLKERKLTDTEQKEEDLKTAIYRANDMARKFYSDQFGAVMGTTRKAAEYAKARGWDTDIAKGFGVGYAPAGNALCNHLLAGGVDEVIIIAAKLGVKDEAEGNQTGLRDFFQNRIIFPITTPSGQTAGFTARALSDKARAKYLNTGDTPVFKKSELLYGYREARRTALAQKVMYVVEGTADVLALQNAGISNVVAPLGTALTGAGRALIKRLTDTVCFIPDNDKEKPEAPMEIPAGNAAVLSHGMDCLKDGMKVLVRELPKLDAAAKMDADSYVHDGGDISALEDVDFPVWGARVKASHSPSTAVGRSRVANWVGEALATITEASYRETLASDIAKELGVPVGAVISKANDQRNAQSEQGKGAAMSEADMLERYGVASKHGYYYAVNDKKDDVVLSNFVLRPLFFLKDINPDRSKRLFFITNTDNITDVIELSAKEMVMLPMFMTHLESQGNYIWKGDKEQLTRLREYLFANTETAKEITQLGWQPEGFYAWGNGITYNGQWCPVDDYGVVRLPDNGAWYLPAFSKLYESNRTAYEFERAFVYKKPSEGVTMRTVHKAMHDAWGDNATVGLCYVFASCFRDIIMLKKNNFPSLNLFGVKGSGKSEFGFALMGFFTSQAKANSIDDGGTLPSLLAVIGQTSDALVFLDEYKNTIDRQRMGILKNLYNATGRSRMSLRDSQKVEFSAVDSGVIIAGQEKPTLDIALFSRMIYCTFYKTSRTPAEKRLLEKFLELRQKGLTHLTVEVINQRERIERGFMDAYNSSMSDLEKQMNGANVEDRIIRSWTTLLAVYRLLEGAIDPGFTYSDCLRIFSKMAVAQNRECRDSNEISEFWNSIDTLRQNGEVFVNIDYRIEPETRFRDHNDGGEMVEFNGPTRLLYISLKRPLMVYMKAAKAAGKTVIPDKTLTFYLEHSGEYLGHKYMRFKNSLNPEDSMAGASAQTRTSTSRTAFAHVFNYDKLVEAYGINLEVDETPYDAQEPNGPATDATETDSQAPF